jgi:ATP-binding cassette, subfamily B, bacterial MsbA
MSTYLRILRYLRPQRRLFLLAIVAMTLDNALDAFSFTLLIPFLDLLFNGGRTLAQGGEMFGAGPIGRVLRWAVAMVTDDPSPMGALRGVVLLLFVVFLVKNVANYLWTFTVVVIEGRVTRDLRRDIYAHLLRLGFPFFQRTRTGQVI